jgi:hypothetical protein
MKKDLLTEIAEGILGGIVVSVLIFIALFVIGHLTRLVL